MVCRLVPRIVPSFTVPFLVEVRVETLSSDGVTCDELEKKRANIAGLTRIGELIICEELSATG